ncbi:MAG: 1,4-dihydroxy-2-naphthoate polyprenyltransferase [Sporomusaceae bacterium]|nr:1,4-dihydroxy-2-naphthoate polyprenyltransferase [Sporomusaceae bacterium]
MSIAAFLKLVEIQTKAASVIPFLLGTFYAAYRFDAFYPEHFLLMLISLLCIDMATTAINNYQDFKTARKRSGYGYERHNAIVSYQLSESSVQLTIVILLLLAASFGLLLVWRTDLIVLLAGVVSFLTGIIYSAGPVPISRTPLGELVSGGCMGFIIPFLAVYIHVTQPPLIQATLSGALLNITANGGEIARILLVSFPAAAAIANIMLANNICDIAEDIENRRYTLPVYIGRASSLNLFRLLYYSIYLLLAGLLLTGVLPLIAAITFASWPIVSGNIKLFCQLQTKRDTFVLAVKTLSPSTPLWP